MPKSRLHEALELVAPLLPGDGFVITLRTVESPTEVVYLGGPLEALVGSESAFLQSSPSDWARLVHPEDAEGLASALRFSSEGGRGSVEYRIVRPDGSVRWLREDFRVPSGPHPGSAGHVLGLVTDLSERRELQESVSALERRLWRGQRMESLGTLVGGFANEFSDLMNTILATAPLVAEEEGLSVVSRANMRIVEGAAARGAALVNQILDFSTRQHAGAESAQVATVAQGLQPILARALGKETRLNVRSERDPWLASCGPEQVEQIILNLVMNAKDAMPAGGEVTIGVLNAELFGPMPVEGGLLPPGRYVHLVVADGGSGISSGDRAHLFDGHYSTKRGGGAGLGLWTVNRIVQRCGGGLTVESHENEGSTFHVYLPSGSQSAIPIPEPTPVVEARGLSRRHRILMVDDDAFVGGVVERSLVRDGHSVVVAKSLSEWLPTLGGAKPAFSLLIVDLGRLQEAGGLEVLIGDVSALPVIFTSRLGATAMDREQGLRQRGVFLPKPIEPLVLSDAISRVIAGDSDRAIGTASG